MALGDLVSLAGVQPRGGALTTPSYNASTQTASGKVPIGSTVVVKVDGTTAGNATVDSAGNWTYVFGSAPASAAVITAVVTSTTGSVTVPGDGGVSPPLGFQFLVGADGAQLLGADTAPLYGIAA